MCRSPSVPQVGAASARVMSVIGLMWASAAALPNVQVEAAVVAAVGEAKPWRQENRGTVQAWQRSGRGKSERVFPVWGGRRVYPGRGAARKDQRQQQQQQSRASSGATKRRRTRARSVVSEGEATRETGNDQPQGQPQGVQEEEQQEGQEQSRRVVQQPSDHAYTLAQSLRGGKSDFLWFWRSSNPKSSVATSIFNLVNNVAGAGMLTLSAGMAAGTGPLAALCICVFLGVASAYTFSLVGYTCHATGHKSFQRMWAHALGRRSAWALELGITVLCFLAAVIYSGIIGDVFTPLLQAAGLPDRFNYRKVNIITVTVAVLAPLSFLQDLSRLKVTSMLGFASVCYTACFMALRAFDGSYKPGGAYYHLVDASSQPLFSPRSLFHVDKTALILFSNLGLAFIAHYNAPKYYSELKEASTKRFNLVVAFSFSILTLIYGSVMLLGYLTFGTNTQGNVLMNYYSHDPLAVLGRFATGLSIIFGFPLTFIGLRDGFSGTAKSILAWRKGFNEDEDTIEGMYNSFVARFLRRCGDGTKRVSLLLLAAVTVLAVSVDDIGFVVGLQGSLLGASICYIIPSLVYVRTMIKRRRATRLTRLNYVFVALGLFLAVLGVAMTVHHHANIPDILAGLGFHGEAEKLNLGH